jgi:hypothetical protein
LSPHLPYSVSPILMDSSLNLTVLSSTQQTAWMSNLSSAQNSHRR